MPDPRSRSARRAASWACALALALTACTGDSAEPAPTGPAPTSPAPTDPAGVPREHSAEELDALLLSAADLPGSPATSGRQEPDDAGSDELGAPRLGYPDCPERETAGPLQGLATRAEAYFLFDDGGSLAQRLFSAAPAPLLDTVRAEFDHATACPELTRRVVTDVGNAEFDVTVAEAEVPAGPGLRMGYVETSVQRPDTGEPSHDVKSVLVAHGGLAMALAGDPEVVDAALGPAWEKLLAGGRG